VQLPPQQTKFSYILDSDFYTQRSIHLDRLPHLSNHTSHLDPKFS
jgi:hypothetical protein